MQTLFLSLMTALSTFFAVPTTKSPGIDKQYIYQHWVISAKESTKTVTVYRPHHLADAKGIEMRHKHAGMIIKKGGKFRQLRWRMCGNDTGPSGYDYQWKWQTQGASQTLLVIKKKATYKVLALSKDMLKVEKLSK
ncbi:hypothetical protein M23134_04840 [Microscilla marina ATCC 23134]|uniref:Uncharacterized protein n=2 Tax=Microscilla marina TaxID=1027 RepID=A1ZS02_MICM2|nr:hypothetical protein M23134_04840 [Microscilla marina ATCC 23134]